MKKKRLLLLRDQKKYYLPYNMKEKITETNLFFGRVVNLYYSFNDLKAPSQIGQINEWLPGLLIVERKETDKREPEYKDLEYKIYANKDDKGFYGGGSSTRVTQILGRLIGTAKSNQEKGRKDAELIRKHLANILVTDFDIIERLQANTANMIDKIDEDRLEDFHHLLFDYMWDLIDSRNNMSPEERNDEPFPFDDYIYDDLIYNVAYQLHLYSYDGLVNAYLWLLLGGFLRNQVGSLLKMYHSGFTAINRQLSEFGSLEEKVYYLYNKDEYYSVYNGDDTENKYPGTTWICDNPNCKSILNMQEGFDEGLDEWKCTDCGLVNKIDHSVIYENEEDYLNNKPIKADDYERAITARKNEINKEK